MSIDKISGCLTPNRFIPIDSEELTALEYMGKLTKKTNEVVENVNQNTNGLKGKLDKTEYYHDIEKNRKLSKDGDFTGSWFGIKSPSYSEPGMAGVVEKNRLDIVDIKNELNGIKHITIANLNNYGVVGDGVADDTDSFQAFINDMTGYVLLPPNLTFKLTDEIIIDKSNVKIDFNGSTINYHNEKSVDLTIDRKSGVFKIHKDVDSTVGDIVSLTQEGNNLSLHTKLTFANKPTISVGEYMIVHVQKTENYSQETLDPCMRYMCRVCSVDGKDVIIDYASPYTYEGEFHFARAYKVSPISDIEIKNVNFNEVHDFQFYTEQSSSIPSDTQAKFISLVNARNVLNLTVHNVKTSNTTNPVILTQDCRNIDIKNLYVGKVAVTCGGRGYGCQINDSIHVTIKNVHCVYVRHACDFTRVAFATVENVQAQNTFGVGFMTHGAFEHDLRFLHCNGSSALGAGLRFGKSSKNVYYENCIIPHFGHSFANGVEMKKCKVNIKPTDWDSSWSTEDGQWQSALFSDCDITMTCGYYGGIQRDLYNGVLLRFERCKIELVAGRSGNVSIAVRKLNMRFTECDVTYKTSSRNENTFGACQVVFEGCYLHNIILTCASNYDTVIRMINTTLSSDIANTTFIHLSATDNDCIVMLSNLKINKGTGLKLVSSGFATSKHKVLVNGCVGTSVTSNLNSSVLKSYVGNIGVE